MTEEKKVEKNYFNDLFSVDLTGHIEEKNGLKYCSWSYSWAELKKRHPDANYTIYENADGWNYFTDGRTAWVKTGVTINGIEHIEYLPIMDLRNNSIPLDKITSVNVNKTIQRSITKAIARHGLGIYVYAGEDLPEEDNGKKPDVKNKPKEQPAQQAPQANIFSPEEMKIIFSDNIAEWLDLVSKAPLEKLDVLYKKWVLKFPKTTKECQQLIQLAKNRKNNVPNIWEGVS